MWVRCKVRATSRSDDDGTSASASAHVGEHEGDGKVDTDDESKAFARAAAKISMAASGQDQDKDQVRDQVGGEEEESAQEAVPREQMARPGDPGVGAGRKEVRGEGVGTGVGAGTDQHPSAGSIPRPGSDSNSESDDPGSSWGRPVVRHGTDAASVGLSRGQEVLCLFGAARWSWLCSVGNAPRELISMRLPVSQEGV